jgi:isoquinoline 1-oxidoreductase
VDRLRVEDGIVSDRENNSRKVSYAELAKGQKIYRELDFEPQIKDHTRFKVMGTSRMHTDAVEKVTGKAKFSGDIQLPGMLYARIVRPPALRAKLLSLDTSEAEKIEGVEIFREDDLVAVLHEHQDTADVAVSKVKAEYDIPQEILNKDNIFDHLLKSAGQGREVQAGGSIEAGTGSADKLLEHEYHDGYVLHSPIENHTATAAMQEGRMVVWGSTQTPFRAKTEVAEALGMEEDNVHVRQVFVGGGFGGKTSNQQIVEAARMARATGRPVQNAWTRREEFLYDRMRPAAVIKIRSGITSDGRIQLWDYGEYFAGTRGADHFYDIPHHRTLTHGQAWGSDVHPFYTGAWRAPGNNTNTWARESQIDIMAAAAGMDPVEFRLKNLRDEQMIRVLKTAADKFGWTPAPAPSGRGYGLSCGIDAGTYVCNIAEAEVDKSSGKVQVKRVTVAQDMGMVVNPQGAIIQVEGCVNMGLGYALSEEIEFEGSNMLTRNFDTYTVTHFSWVPEIDVHLIEAQDMPPQGGGEPAIINMGGCIANAIFDAVGARLYHLPMTPERVLEAIKKA